MVYLDTGETSIVGDTLIGGEAGRSGAQSHTTDEPARIGLIVGKAVGGSVVRHQVSRRLRAQLSDRLHVLPGGSRLVVRALPGSATASSETISRDLDSAFRKLSLSATAPGRPGSGSAPAGARVRPRS